MSGGLRYRLAQWAERHVPRLVLKYEGMGPTGRHIHRNVLGRYELTREKRL